MAAREGGEQPGRQTQRLPASGQPAAPPSPPRPRPSPARPPAQKPIARPMRRRRVVVRKIDPWSVLKLSLIFYFCLLLVVMLGLTVFWAVITRAGVIAGLLSFSEETLNVAVDIRGGNIARALFLIGLLNVVLFSAINVFIAFLYNLIADLVGGLRVTLGEEE